MKEPPSLDDRWNAIWAVFHEAVNRPHALRAPMLDQVCAGDQELRREVEELLAAHDGGVPILDNSLFDLTPTLPAEKDWIVAPAFGSGMVLAGRFEIRRRIAVGGMGEVYEAWDRELARAVALKTLISERAQRASALARFRKEIQLAQQVTHRNVCRVFDLVRDDGVVFLTMELLEGETLAQRLRRGGQLSLDETRTILEQIVAALEAAHAVGVVHRDLKPSNIMLVEDSSGLRAVVTDFGLATSGGTFASDDESHLTRTGELLGTPAYMAPEQLEGEEVSTATDVYAVGLLLYEMVTGCRPFAGGSAFSVANRRLVSLPAPPRDHVANLDERWERVILHCLERAPADRFQHPREIVEMLEMDSPRMPPSNIRQRRQRRQRRLMVAVLVVLLIPLAWWAVRQRWAVDPDQIEGNPIGFEKRDTVIVAAFDNRTGDPSLDAILDVALARDLSSSTFVDVASRARISDALALMRLPADVSIDREIARQVALRDGGIQGVIAGDVERVGERIVMTAVAIAPGDGSTLASWTEEAEGASSVGEAIERIALGIRQHFGESPHRVAESARKLERVTTPSLRALRLYDEADRLFQSDVQPAADRRWAAAEELLRQAVREDPDFASAHILLAFAIHNQGRSSDEYMPFAERAMQLSEDIPDRERYFIRGSYFSFKGETEKMLAAYEALLQLHPDHYWANNNVAFNVSPAEAVPYLVRNAEHRPNHITANFLAGFALSIIENRPEDAEPFVDRVIRISKHTGSPGFASYAAPWAQVWKGHRQWSLGNLEAAESILDRLSRDVQGRNDTAAYGLRQFLIRAYRALGQRDKAFAALPMPDYGLSYRYLQGADAYYERRVEGTLILAGEEWNENRNSFDALLMDPFRVAVLARMGWIDEARAASAQFSETPRYYLQTHPKGVEERMKGELLLAKGDPNGAVRLLESLTTSADWGHTHDLHRNLEMYGASFFLAAQALADSYAELGRPEEALAVLERAVAEQNRAFPNGAEAWLDTKLRLARLHRALGNDERAETLENELRNLMRLADPDFWLVRELDTIGG